MISIIIPAHNEASVIGRCCRSLIEGANFDDIEIIVVCNGCTDNTAEVAWKVSEDIIIIETELASKSNALNLGDSRASGFPRFYIDADVIVPLKSVLQVSDLLRDESGVHAATPSIVVNLDHSNELVKAFYRVWLEMPYCRNGMIGSGMYAVSEEGRGRFEKFPPIIADDEYVRLLFQPNERVTVQNCLFTINSPQRLKSVIAINIRVHYGILELKKLYPAMFENEGEKHLPTLFELSSKPSWWWPLCVYLFVRVVSRIMAWRNFWVKGAQEWSRDESSRQCDHG